MASGSAVRYVRQRRATTPIPASAGGCFVTAILVIAFLIAAVWLFVGWGGPRTIDVVGGVASVLVTSAAAACATLAARATTGPVRIAWTVMAVGSVAATVGESIWAGRDLLGWKVSFPSVADAAYLMFPVAVLVALLLFPSGRGRQSQSRLLLDGVIMGGSLLIVSWLTVMRGAYSAGGQSQLHLVVSLTYPLMNLVTLTVAAVVLASAGAGARSTLTLVTLGLFCMTLAESVFAYLSVGNGPFSGHHLVEITWMAGVLLIALGAAHGRDAVFDQRPGEVPGWTSVWLPYAPFMVAAVMVAVGPRGASTDGLILVTGVILVVAVLARQFLAVSETKRLVDTITDLALRDPLTGLANRTLFADRLAGILASRSDSDTHPVSVLVLDLDGFKPLNDTLGHSFGDEVLVAVAQRLGRVAGPADTVARLGGDEFAVLLRISPDRAHDIARQLSAEFESPFLIAGQPAQVGASIGVATARPQDTTAEELLKRADLTMYAAKRRRAAPARRVLEAADADSPTLLAELRQAVAQAQLVLVYQPQIDLLTRRVVGVEALLRWPHPDHGVLLPGRFLPLVRDHDLMAAITDLVVEHALDDARSWQRAGVDIPVSVNVFAPMMADLALPERIGAALAERGLDPDMLTVEITEDLPLGRIGPTKIVLNELRRRGVRISIDDFGAGYPALSYLCHLSVDEVKLDRNFIGPQLADPRVEAVVRAVVALAGQLGLTVVAEGATDAQIVARLIAWDVGIAQGDYLGAPVDSGDVPGLVRNSTAGLGVAP